MSWNAELAYDVTPKSGPMLRGGRLDVMLATDALVMALEVEGWMTRPPRQAHSRQKQCGDLVVITLMQGTNQTRALMKLAA